MTRAVTTVRIINNKSSVPPLSLNLTQTAPIYRVALTSGQLALVGSGGAGGYTYSATGLPSGLTLNTATGAITGTPTTIGHNVITATVTDSATNTFTTTFSVEVLTRVAIVGTFQPVAEVGLAVSNPLAVTGATGAVTWSIAGGPSPGGALSFNTTTATLSGTPTVTGSWSGTVTASDSGTGESATYTFAQTIVAALDSSAANITAYYGSEFSIDITKGVTGGLGPYRFTVFAFGPPWDQWIKFNPSTNIVSGLVPVDQYGVVPDTFIGAFRVDDALGSFATPIAVGANFLKSQPIVQPQKAAANVGPAGPSKINFEFPSSGTPDVTNDGTTMTVTIPTVAGPTGPSGHGSTTTTAAPSASGGSWIFTVADTTAFRAVGLPIYCVDVANASNWIRGHVISFSSTQLTVAPDATGGTISSITNGSTFTFSGVAGPTGPAGGGGGGDRRIALLEAY